MKNSWIFVYFQVTHRRTSFNFTRFIFQKNLKIPEKVLLSGIIVFKITQPFICLLAHLSWITLFLFCSKRHFKIQQQYFFLDIWPPPCVLYEKINNESGGRAHLCFFCRRAFHSLLRLNESLKRTKGTQCLKIIEKVAFYIASKASYVYILNGKEFIENAKNSQFGEFLKMRHFEGFSNTVMATSI